MANRKIQTLIIIFWILFTCFSWSVAGSIVDTPLALLSPAQKAWLVDERQKAWSLYSQELSISQDKTVPAFNLAFLAFLDDRFDITQRYLDLSLAQNPNYGPALLLRARLLYQQNQVSLALKTITQALKYHPASYLPAYYRGLMNMEQGNLSQAMKDFILTLDINDKFSPAYVPLARLYLREGRYNEAGKILEKGLATSYDAEIILTLAEYHAAIKNEKSAARYYCLFVYFFPTHPAFNKAQKWLSDHDIKNTNPPGFSALPNRKSSSIDFIVGENYVYNVHWGPIKVGELNTVIAEKLNFQGRPAYKVIFSLDSNPALEFIASLHSDYITIVDAVTKQTIQHFLHVRENRLVYEKVYDFLRESNKFVCRTINEDGSIDILEKYLPENAIDGTSILFYSRQVVNDKRSERILTTIDENFVISDIVYENKSEPVTVRNRIERGILISGENYYKGIVGFTGKFRGWFRNDPTFLPIQADFEIWVGRIAITMASEEEQKAHRYAR